MFLLAKLSGAVSRNYMILTRQSPVPVTRPHSAAASSQQNFKLPTTGQLSVLRRFQALATDSFRMRRQNKAARRRTLRVLCSARHAPAQRLELRSSRTLIF